MAAEVHDPTDRSSTLKVGLCVCALAAGLVFLLPFAIPMPLVHTVSASYVAGFNNRVAILAAASLGALVLLWSWWRAPRATPIPAEEYEPLPARWVASAIAGTCAFTAGAAWLVIHSGLRYLADSGYVIEQLAAHGDGHRALYSQLEFAYGPLLFYPAVWMHAMLRCSWPVAYWVTLALNQALGLGLLGYILNALPIPRRERRVVFVLLTVGAITPLLGLNYTFFRFLTPFAALLYATRTESLRRTTLLLAAGEVLSLAISPEMGFTFVFATVVFAGLAAWKRGARWLLAAAAPPIGLAIFLALFGPAYLKMLQSVAHGALNLPVAPYPHIVIYLFAVVWLIPIALGPELRSEDPRGIQLASCYLLALALLPAAFGRCDPLHVFFNGAGILILSVVSTRHSTRRVRTVWLAMLLVFVGWTHFVNDSLYADRTRDTLRLALTHDKQPEDDDYVLDTDALAREVGPAQVATPLEVSVTTEQALKRTHHYRTGYYAFFVDVMDPAAEARKIDELNQADWALLPADYDSPFLETPRNIGEVQGFAYPYPNRHPVPYDLGQPFADNLAANWTPVRRFGPYMLYRRAPSAGAPGGRPGL